MGGRYRLKVAFVGLGPKSLMVISEALLAGSNKVRAVMRRAEM